jgi:hypothetical protein
MKPSHASLPLTTAARLPYAAPAIALPPTIHANIRNRRRVPALITAP